MGTGATCPDCGGPLVVAFDSTDNYRRCSRCGHVFLTTKDEN